MTIKLTQKSSMLLLLSFTEMWERFSYYGMRALLVLFLTSTLGFADSKAYAIYSLFAAIGYAVPMLAGILADKLIGFQRTLIIGAIIMCLGHLSMAISDQSEFILYCGLSLIAVGTGFFKGNITSVLGTLYTSAETKQRDKSFSLFNVAINMGSLIASLSCGYVAHKFGWHYGFALAGIGMVLGLLTFLRFRHILGEHGNKPNQSSTKQNTTLRSALIKAISVAIILCLVVLGLFNNSEASLRYLSITGIIAFIFLAKVFFQCNNNERIRILTLLILTIFFVGFIAVEMQLGSLMNLFTLRNVNKSILGYEISAASLQALNPFFVILFGSLFASIFAKFGHTAYMKRFAIGLLINIICFMVIVLGCSKATEGLVNLNYVIISMACMSFVEICLFPMIQVLFTALAPERYKGFMMGILLFGISYSNMASIIIAKFMSIPKEHIDNSSVSLIIYQSGFQTITFFAIGLFICFMIVAPFLNRVIKQA